MSFLEFKENLKQLSICYKDQSPHHGNHTFSGPNDPTGIFAAFLSSNLYQSKKVYSPFPQNAMNLSNFISLLKSFPQSYCNSCTLSARKNPNPPKHSCKPISCMKAFSKAFVFPFLPFLLPILLSEVNYFLALCFLQELFKMIILVCMTLLYVWSIYYSFLKNCMSSLCRFVHSDIYPTFAECLLCSTYLNIQISKQLKLLRLIYKIL